MRRDLKDLVRKNIWNLKPYSSARDEFSASASVYLDANENPFDNGVNRYPDSSHTALKKQLADRRGLKSSQILLGNGSDEILDLLFRSFCEPGKDNIIITPPTYGMYKVIADINDIEVRQSLLTTDFQLNTREILSLVDEHTKLIALCSPNNPSGISLSQESIEEILNNVDCMVVVDEAYIEFSNQPSWVDRIDKYSNLFISQTFSKAWGMAGIRLGIGIGSSDVIEILHRVKPPYNINTLTETRALEGLAEADLHKERVDEILSERETLSRQLEQLSLVEQVLPSDANFLLIRVGNADKIYQYLMEKEIIVRNRSNQVNCENSLRITVGTKEENALLIQALKSYEE